MNAEVVAVPAIETWPVIVALSENEWLLTTIKTLHLVGAIMLIGPVVAFDLRILGINRTIEITSLARLLLPLALAAVAVIIPTGLALFAVDGTRLLGDGPFMLKMGLIFAGGVLAIAFHVGPYRSASSWSAVPATAKLCAIGSIGGWSGVVFCAAIVGRG